MTHHSNINQCEYRERCDRRRPPPEHEKNRRTLAHDTVVCKPNFATAYSNAESVVDVGSASPNPEQMDTRLHLCEEALELIAEDTDFLDLVITVDES